MISIKNTTSEPKTWHGQEIAAGASYELQASERRLWGNDSDVLKAIGSGDALLIHNDVEIHDVAIAINILIDATFTSFNKDNAPLVDMSLRVGSVGTETMTYTTPDFTDRTCWYQKSIKVENEILTDSGDHKTFTSVHPWWIDIHHYKLALDWAKIPNRDGTLSNFDKWEAQVCVSGVPQTTGFAIDYVSGTVTFDSVQSDPITATYWTNDGVVNPSEYLIVPPAGKRFLVEHVEMQFSQNLQWKTPVYFEVWAGADLATYGDFPDYLYDAGYGQGRSMYRSIRDCISWFNNGMGITIPAPTAEFANDIICFPFLFLVATEMRSDQGTLLRLYLKDNIEFVGEIGTATIYMEMNNL